MYEKFVWTSSITHPFPTSSVFQDEKLFFFSCDLIKTNLFCSSSSRYQKNATDKVAKLVTD